jgi:hypothetical protein
MLKFWTRWVLLRHPIVDPSISIPPKAATRSEIGAAFPASI